MYKHLTQSDITVRPFKTYKNWTVQSLNTSSVDSFGEGTYISGKMGINEGLRIDGFFYESGSSFSQEPVNPSGEYKRITYSQVQSMFYSGDKNPLKQFGVENWGTNSNTSVGEVRTISDRILVGKISKDLWGEEIKPESVHLTDYSDPHTIFEIYDDGYTNLFITSSHFSTYEQVRAIKSVESHSFYFAGRGRFFFRGNEVTFQQARDLRAAGGQVDYVEAPDSWVYPPDALKSPPLNIYDPTTERFGSSVSAWYKYIAVGSPLDAQNFTTSSRGQVNLFEYDDNMNSHRFVRTFRSTNYPDTSSYNFFREQDPNWKATASIQWQASASMMDSFGYDVAIRDNYMAIGAPTEDTNATGSLSRGIVYIYYKFKGGADHWGLVGTLVGSGSNYRFGESVSISNDLLVVGAPGANNNTGSVYVYRNLSNVDTGSFVWNLEATLTSTQAGPSDFFGADLEVSNERLVVGNRKVNGPGYVSVFTSSFVESSSLYATTPYLFYSSSYHTSSISASWGEMRAFRRNSDPGDLNLHSPYTALEVSESVDYFGSKVSIDGDNMAVCCFSDKSFLISGTVHSLGAVYFYNYGYDLDCHIYDFTFRNKTFGDRSFAVNNNFARSISLRGGTAAIGYLPDQLQYSASLSASIMDDPTGSLLIEHFTYVGSSAADVNGILGRVSIYDFDSKNITWGISNTIKRNKQANLPSYVFGYSVALSDAISGSTFLAVGAPTFTYAVSGSNASALITATGSAYSTQTGSFYSPYSAYTSWVSGSISGSMFVYNLDNYEENPKIGNVFYKNGEVTITHPGRDYQNIMFNTGSTGFNLDFQGTHTIFEHEYLVSITPGDFNFSTNPTALLNQAALFDVNQDGIFDFKDVDLILRFLNRQRYYTIVDEDDNAIVLNQDTLEDESWWNADILQTESEDVLLLEALFVANQTVATDLSGGILTDAIYQYIKKNLADTMILDIDKNGVIDERDGAFLLSYWLGTLSDARISQLLDTNSKRIYFKDIKNYIETYTGVLNGFIINPLFHEYLISSSYDPTGSYLAPVITTIGLYDEHNELAIIGKLGRPIKNLLDWPVNIIVRFDT